MNVQTKPSLGAAQRRLPFERVVCVPKTLNPTIVVMKSAQDGA
jgi:hypothetical protein